MKISQMLEREDFYTINEKTLAGYFDKSLTDRTELCIYPQLNAIVTKRPSRQVIDYLQCEYSVRGNKLKHLAVWGYVQGCLHSFGALSAKKCIVQYEVNRDTLIYPCNKKYRVFYFQQQIVDVIVKNGFDDADLRHEIEFRKKEDLPDFVPGFISCGINYYREAIIDGRPLARITEGFETFRDRAYQSLLEYGAAQQKVVKANIYSVDLNTKITHLVQKKASNASVVIEIAACLAKQATVDVEVILSFSHGDLQAGNIWVENKTQKIYIIDWESWGTRSIWYDYATLYQGLRPGNINGYLTEDVPKLERSIVLLEDIIFHLHELNSLPDDFGLEQFGQYCDTIAKWLKIGV